MAEEKSRFLDFKNAISNSHRTARDNQFLVEFITPMDKNNPEDSKLLSLYCDSVSIPSKNIASSPYMIEHATHEMPYGISYEPVTMTFYVDEAHHMRAVFNAWYESIFDPQRSGIEFYDSYTTSITIKSLSRAKEDLVAYTTILRNAYPKSVSSIPYSSDGTSQVVKLTVQFYYDRLEEMESSSFSEDYIKAQALQTSLAKAKGNTSSVNQATPINSNVTTPVQSSSAQSKETNGIPSVQNTIVDPLPGTNILIMPRHTRANNTPENIY